jgi:micrococcal nuclease
MELKLYQYKAVVVYVYDGDTIRVDIDLGLKTWVRTEAIRLSRINAPELRGPERPQGLLARDFLKELILDKEIILETIKDTKGKYGRYIGEIWIEKDSEWKNASDMMVSSGHAVYAQY